ncbi:MAG: radical SAM protein [Dehalococcoidia bacterium]|nr:radical SAM protein [Dehalococcoidia bacterium]
MLGNCGLCPRHCRVDRLEGELGQCHTGPAAMVSSCGPHFGEESPLVGTGGSGTIFFTYCNLHCVFCQNYSISQLGEGSEVTALELAQMMLSLQRRGCHNINLVSPTHVVPQILEALEAAVARGLTLPLVYNCGGYESLDTLRLLEGVVDIYMPDMKYADSAVGRRYSAVDNYAEFNRAAVKEMHRQVGDLQTDDQGIAVRGLLVRHLVLPHGLAGTEKTAAFLAHEISRHTYVNIMAQYHPCHLAYEFPELSRGITRQEYLEAVTLAVRHGLTRLDQMEYPRTARVML